MSNPISLKLRRVFFEQKWERSCFFGNPDIPIIYLRIIEDDEFFFAQINLEEVTKVYNSYLLPNKGMLFFFIRMSDYKPIVRYYSKNGYDEDKKARVNFNNVINSKYDLLTEYRIKFIHSHKKLPCLFLDEETKYEEMFDDEIILLKYDQRNNAKISLTDGIILFVIRKEDLIQRNYEAVRMIIVH